MPLFLDQVAPNPLYMSGALKVVKSTALNQDAGTPVLDVELPETQKLQAIVGATGSTFVDVHVQFWALAFATSAAPSLFLDSMGGPKGRVVPAANVGETVVPGTPKTFDTPWDKARDLSSADPQIKSLFGGTVPQVGQLHCCILGNVYAPDDGTRILTDTGPVLDIAGNRHHAQRNMTIKTHAAGVAMNFIMHAANPDREREREVLLQIEEVRRREFQPVELEELAALPWIRRSRERFKGDVVPGLEIAFGDRRLPIRLAKRPLEGLQIELGDAAGPELKLTLGPDEPRLMRLNASLPKEEFVLRTLDVTQIQGGETVGGARVLLLTAPEELLEKQPRNGDSRG